MLAPFASKVMFNQCCILGALCILYDKGPQNLSSWNQKPRPEGTLQDFTILIQREFYAHLLSGFPCWAAGNRKRLHLAQKTVFIGFPAYGFRIQDLGCSCRSTDSQFGDANAAKLSGVRITVDSRCECARCTDEETNDSCYNPRPVHLQYPVFSAFTLKAS